MLFIASVLRKNWPGIHYKKYSTLTWFCWLFLAYPHEQEKPVWWQSRTWSCFHQDFFFPFCYCIELPCSSVGCYITIRMVRRWAATTRTLGEVLVYFDRGKLGTVVFLACQETSIRWQWWWLIGPYSQTSLPSSAWESALLSRLIFGFLQQVSFILVVLNLS